MKCISCGASLQGSSIGTLVKCDFCGTSNAFIPRATFDKADPASSLDDSEQKIFQGILNDIDAGEFEDAYEALTDLLRDNGTSWQVHTNLAICVFALGSDDFAHLPEVIKHLRKALSFSSNADETFPYVRSIAFNVAQVCLLKNRFGQNLLNCIDALEKTVELVPDYPDRDSLLVKFVSTNQESLVRDLMTLVKREKKNFDPPRTLSETLIRLVLLSPSANKEATALALIVGTKKSPTALNVSSTAFESLKQTYFSAFNKTKVPTIEFPMFSEPKISL